jgi:hypothetical protein
MHQIWQLASSTICLVNILSLDIMLFDILSNNIMPFDILSLDIMPFDILSLDIMLVDILSLDIMPFDILDIWISTSKRSAHGGQCYDFLKTIFVEKFGGAIGKCVSNYSHLGST